MNKEEKDKKGINFGIKIFMSLIIFTIILFWGLAILENSLNSMIGMKNEISIFAFEQKSQNMYDVTFMGKSKEVNIKTIRLIFKQYGGAIESWGATYKVIPLDVFNKIARWCNIK